MSEAVNSSDTIFRISDTFRKSNTILRISNPLMCHSGHPTHGHGNPVVAWSRLVTHFLPPHRCSCFSTMNELERLLARLPGVILDTFRDESFTRNFRARNQELFLDTHWVDLDDLKSWLHTKHLSSYLLEDENSESIGIELQFLNHSRKWAAFTLHSEAPPSRIMLTESSGVPVIIPESGRRTRRKLKPWSVMHDNQTYTSFEFLAQFPDEYRALYGDIEPAYICAFSHYS
ncbi:hypothetical protein K438DRAFT_1786576 [Mycena galopus ATCC 62051]|nr:hypothetical protein K438DRAFT_1786576 [Mycena galopus ATCC 62051]